MEFLELKILTEQRLRQKLATSLMALSDLLQGCSNKSVTVMM
jgi:hypothetical protein